MLARKRIRRVIAAMLSLSLVLAVAGFAAAQDDNQPAPYLGIAVTSAENGAQVVEVVPGSPADEAGLQVDDIITNVEDGEVTAEGLAAIIGGYAVGDTVTLTVDRDGETVELTATLAERPADAEADGPQGRMQMRERAFLGVTLEETEDGFAVLAVQPGSAAEDAGLQAGDVITAINGEAVSTAQAATDLIAALRPGDTVTLDITRDGESQTVEATLGATRAFGPGGPNGRGLFQGMMSDEAIAFNSADETWIVLNLAEDSALYAAGLRTGDVITEFDGEAYTPDALTEFLNNLEADAPVSVTIERDGETQELDIAAGELRSLVTPMLRFNGEMGEIPFGMFADPGQGTRLGVQFVQLNAEVAEERGIETVEGALITEVLPDTPAAEAGLQVDDIVLAVNGEPVNEEITLRDRLFVYEGGDTITLSVLRADEELDLDVTLAEGQMGMMPGNMPFFFEFGPRGDGQGFEGMPHGGFRFELPEGMLPEDLEEIYQFELPELVAPDIPVEPAAPMV